jgi:hypothetical protein
MRNRQLGKWLLIVTCLAMALCLVQRAVMLNHFLQGLDPQISLSADARLKAATLNSPARRPVSWAHTRCFAQPLFFDGALPAIIIFFALLQLLTQGRVLARGTARSGTASPNTP